MKKAAKWLLLLNKRLYKKLTFLLILLLIPILVAGYGTTAQEESGMMTIALAQYGNDPMATQVIEKLKNEPSLILFVVCQDPVEAENMVRNGKAEAAWIFPENMEQKVYKFIHSPTVFNSFIRIYEQGDSIPLRLTREKLSGTLFSLCSRVFYLEYLRENVPELDAVSDEALLQHYDDFASDATLFEFAYLDGHNGAEDLENANYLTTPVRGLLAVVVVLAGLAAAMYYVQDTNSGTFSLVPAQHRSLTEFACQMITILNTAAVMLLALLISSLSRDFVRELLILGLYCLAVALFCMNIRIWCGSLTVLGGVLPLLIVLMLVICPVFFDFAAIRYIQFLFPPTYYINAVVSNEYLKHLAVYILGLGITCFLSGKILKTQ